MGDKSEVKDSEVLYQTHQNDETKAKLIAIARNLGLFKCRELNMNPHIFRNLCLFYSF